MKCLKNKKKKEIKQEMEDLEVDYIEAESGEYFTEEDMDEMIEE